MEKHPLKKTSWNSDRTVRPTASEPRDAPFQPLVCAAWTVSVCGCGPTLGGQEAGISTLLSLLLQKLCSRQPRRTRETAEKGRPRITVSPGCQEGRARCPHSGAIRAGHGHQDSVPKPHQTHQNWVGSSLHKCLKHTFVQILTWGQLLIQV